MPTTTRAAVSYPSNTASPTPVNHQNMVNSIDTQLIARFATTAARDTAIPAPVAGMMAYTSTEDKFWIYRTAWVQQNFRRVVLKDTPTARTLTPPGSASADPTLVFPVKASKSYVCEFVLHVTGDPAVDFAYGWTGPAGASGMLFNYSMQPAGTTAADSGAAFYSYTTPFAVGAGFICGVESTTVATVVKGRLLVTTGVTAGTVSLIWSQQNSSALAVTVLQDSYLVVTEIN